MYFKIILLLFLLVFSSEIYSQKIENEDVSEKILTQIQQQLDTDIDIIFLKDIVNELLLKPINLNTTTKEELIRIRFLTLNKIETIMRFLGDGNQFVSVDELFSLPEFNEHDKILSPLFTVQKKQESINDKSVYNHLAVFSTGHLDDHSTYKYDVRKNYLGKPQNYFFRYVFQQNKGLSVGLTLQNDYYEPFFSQYNRLKFQTSHNGFDYVSAWIKIIPKKGVLKEIIIGNYALYFGQGLCFWNGYTINKSSFVTDLIKNREEISPHTSAGEYQFLSGTCFTISTTKNWKTTPFVSFKKINSKERIINDEISYSIDESGIHQNYNTNYFTTEKIFGVRNSFNFNKFYVGNTTYSQEYNQPINPQNGLYDKFEFRQKSLLTTSFDYQLNIKKTSFFGEQTFQSQGIRSGLYGATITVSNAIETSILYRNFDKSNYGPYGNPFRENTEPCNEKGIYWGLKNQLTKDLTIRLYTDLSHSPWLKYLKNSPTQTKEIFAQLEYVPNEKFNAYFRYKKENTQLNYHPDSLDLIYFNNSNLNTYRYHQQYVISKKITLRNRLELKQFSDDFQTSYNGYLIYQDIIYKNYSRFGINTRFAFAYIEDYKVRIYTNESSLPYSQTNSVFSRNTFQWYVILQYKLTRHLKSWLKINVINGNYKEESNTQTIEKNYFTLTLKYDLI